MSAIFIMWVPTGIRPPLKILKNQRDLFFRVVDPEHLVKDFNCVDSSADNFLYYFCRYDRIFRLRVCNTYAILYSINRPKRVPGIR